MAETQTLNPQAAALLRQAAGLVQRALVVLDTREERCKDCGLLHFVDKTQGFAHKQLTDTPPKLERLAAQLAGEPQALAERQKRRVQDRDVKRGRR